MLGAAALGATATVRGSILAPLLRNRHCSGHIPAQLRVLPVEFYRDSIRDVALFVLTQRADAADRAIEWRAQLGLGFGHLGELEGGLSALHVGSRHRQIALGRTGAQLVQVRLGLVDCGLGRAERASALLADQLVEPGLAARTAARDAA